MLRQTASIVVFLTLASGFTLADDRPGHYSGKQAESLEEALHYLREYRNELASIVQEADFGSDRLHEVHEITYTLENALQTLDMELKAIAGTLESVHIASERGETDRVARDAAAFIEKTGILLRDTNGS